MRHAISVAVMATLGVISVPASSAIFTPGNLAIYRVGTGTGNLVNTGNPVFIDEYTAAGALVQSIAMPTAASGSSYPLISSGTATSEGGLTLSSNGAYLVLTGYGTTTGGATSLSTTSASTVPRVVGLLGADGIANTTTALTDFSSSNNPRSAASTDGNSLWVAGGAGGVRYTTLGATTSTQLSTTVTNIRQVNIFDNQLYASDGSGTTNRLGTVGTGLPITSGQTITNLPGFATNAGSPYGFFFADLSQTVTGVDTLYVADDAVGITKYTLSSGTWTSNGTSGTGTDAYRGLTGSVSNSIVSLFATRKGGSAAAGGGELVSLSDSSGYNGSFTGLTPSVLATASTNTAFRGVAFAPTAVPVPAAVWLFGSAMTALLGIRRRRSH